MPDNELEELEDNFWCHNHDHKHEHDHDHGASHNETNEDRYKFKKSILFNNTTLLVNENHVNFDNLSISSEDNITVKCSKCFFKIGFKKRKHSDYVYLWRSNVLIDDALKFDLFSLLLLGRYIIEIKNEENKKLFIFIHILTTELLYNCIEIKPTATSSNDGSNNVCFDRKWKKLLYKIYDQQSDGQLRTTWFNDINVEFINISYYFYLKILKQLVESTKQLPRSQQKTKNGFFVAVV